MREEDAPAPATARSHVARMISIVGQSGPVMEIVRKVVEVFEEIGKGKESLEPAVKSEPAGVEQTTEKPGVKSQGSGRYLAKVQREPAKRYRANLGAATEAVGAEEPEHGVEKASPEKSEDGDSGGVWVTPKAKKTARKRSVTS